MLKFFDLYKRKITGISNTAFYNQIGIIFRPFWFCNQKLLTTKTQRHRVLKQTTYALSGSKPLSA